jgi:hypothetical protein
MVERFGIQDHSPQLTQHALQNPTNPGNYNSLGGGDGAVYAPTYGGGPPPDVAGIPAGPYTKGYITAVLLAALFGPFGLLYTTRKGALFLLAVFAAIGYYLGGEDFLDKESIMGPMTLWGRGLAIVWTIFAARAFNRRALGKNTEDVAI